MNGSDKPLKTIAIQGGYGAFHEIAANKYFGEGVVEIVPRNTFKDLFKALKDRKVDYGITAIENSSYADFDVELPKIHHIRICYSK